MLVEGDRLVDIDRALFMSKGGAKNYLRFLTAEQLSLRRLHESNRPKASGGQPSSHREGSELKRALLGLGPGVAFHRFCRTSQPT